MGGRKRSLGMGIWLGVRFFRDLAGSEIFRGSAGSEIF